MKQTEQRNAQNVHQFFFVPLELRRVFQCRRIFYKKLAGKNSAES